MSGLFEVFSKRDPSSFCRREIEKESHKKLDIPVVVDTVK